MRFKVWDKKNKKWITDFLKYARDNGTNVPELMQTDECEVIQSTGMFDRKGREIWQGDILKHKFEEGTKTVMIEWAISNCLSCSGWKAILFPEMGPVDHLHTEENSTVIGNKFEHPYLVGTP